MTRNWEAARYWGEGCGVDVWISPSGYPGYSAVGGDEGGQQCEMYNS